MKKYFEEIFQKIDELSPIHAKKLRKNREYFDDQYYVLSNAFFGKYLKLLAEDDKTIDYAVDCYLNMITDMRVEGFEFARTGKYSSNTFEEVRARVYAKPETMEYYMHGLIMSQFLWKHHYQMFDYFIQTFPNYVGEVDNYLEIGAGHGLYLSKAMEKLKESASVTVVDVSETSIELAKKFTNDSRPAFHLTDIFDFSNQTKYEFITIGEVIEHVEDPFRLLQKLNELLADNGTIFITTPTNAPAIDHIYLFNNIFEIRDLIKRAGFRIVSERSFFSEDVSPEKAEKYKIAILYGAFLKKGVN